MVKKKTATFKMVGSQVAFYAPDLVLRKKYLQDLHHLFLLRLYSTMMNYSYSGDQIITMQFLVYSFNFDDKVKKS